MVEEIITQVTERILDFDTEQIKKVQTALYIVLNKYDIQEKSTEIRCIETSWRKELEMFLTRKKGSGKSDKTIKQYNYHLKRVLGYINKNVSDITEGDLNGFLDAYKRIRNVSNVYLDGIRLVISSFFTWLHKKGIIAKNPSEGIEPIKCPKKLKKPYSDEELEKLRRQCDKNIRDLSIIEVLYTSGVRVSELCALNIDDVDLDARTAVVYGKGQKEREVQLSPVACMYLSAYLYQRKDNNEALFVSKRKPNRRMTAAGVQAMVRKAGLCCGCHAHPHRFRRTLATNLLRKGMPIEEVKELLGHEKLDTTLIYVSVNKDKVKSDYNRCMSA